MLLAGCAVAVPPCPAGTASFDLVTLVDRGWHVEVALSAADLTGGLAVFRDIFPGAKAVAFGYGKRTFFTAPANTLSEYLLGPVPGPAAIQATGLSVAAPEAYAAADVAVIRLPPGSADRIARFIWDDIARDQRGGPLLIGPGPFSGSLFYAARSRYSLDRTCNAWSADALQAGGLPVEPSGVLLSSQVMSRAVSAGACALAR